MDLPVELPVRPPTQTPAASTAPVSVPASVPVPAPVLQPTIEIKDLCSTLCAIGPNIECLGYLCDDQKSTTNFDLLKIYSQSMEKTQSLALRLSSRGKRGLAGMIGIKLQVSLLRRYYSCNLPHGWQTRWRRRAYSSIGVAQRSSLSILTYNNRSHQ